MERKWSLVRIAVCAAAWTLAYMPSVANASAPEPGASPIVGKAFAQAPKADPLVPPPPSAGAAATTAKDGQGTETRPVRNLDSQEQRDEAAPEPKQSQSQSLSPSPSTSTCEPGSAGEVGPVHGSYPCDDMFVPVGDDQMPSEYDQKNNPYAQSEAAIGASTEHAFLPPTVTNEKKLGAEQGNELLAVLGPEVFGRRVNITTPPDTDVAEVIRLLAERANLNFIYGEGVIRGRVTLNLRDVPLGVALQSLLATHGLQMIREGENVMRIVPMRELQPGQVEMRTISIKLNWVPARSIIPTLQGMRAGSTGTVRAHAETNTIIITDTPTNLAIIRDLVAQLDVPEKQVMIEARMAEMLIDNGRSLGSRTVLERVDPSGNSPGIGQLDGNAAHTEKVEKVVIDPTTGKPTIETVTIDKAAKSVDNFVGNLLVGNAAAGVINFGGVVSILGHQFDVGATLDALETRNAAHVLANPRVVTLNNTEAVIDIKRDIPYLEAQQGVSQGVVSATVKFKEAGVRLTCLPVITNNGFIRMRLEPEQLIRVGTFDGGTGPVPIIDRRTAITNVIVKDEDTVVLGGLRELDSSDAKTQFPWIAQAPVIGWFFKKDTKLMLKNDLMLFVTPHIVKAPIMSAAENYMVTRIDANWDLPDFFFDDTIELRENHHRGEADESARGFVQQTLKLPPPVPAPTAGEGEGCAPAGGETSGSEALLPPPDMK